MAQRTAGVHRHIHYAAADIHHANAEFRSLVKHRVARGQTGEISWSTGPQRSMALTMFFAIPVAGNQTQPGSFACARRQLNRF